MGKGRPTEESLKRAPPKLRALLARHDLEYARVSKVLGCSIPYVGALVRGEKNLSADMAAKIEAALENGEPPPDTKKRGGNRKKVTAKHPLLLQLYEKFGSWTKAGQAMGYTGAGLIYHWNSGQAEFTEQAQQRVRDVLEGKAVHHPIVRRIKNRVDKGEMGLAIVTVEQPGLERLLDVAESMGAISVFQKRLTPTSWLIIYRFAGDSASDDMMAFRVWAEKRAEVVTP